MTDTTEVRSERLPSRPGQGEAPGEIVYTHYTYKRTNPKGRRASATKRSYVVRPPAIAAFVDARIKGRDLPLHIQTRHPDPDDRIKDQWYHIYVGQPCWVVIELDREIDWQFAPGQPGITVEPGHNDDNCDLEHVMSDGTLAGPVAPATGVCRLIYFRVQRRDDIQHQQFHCNILHGRKRQDGPDMIDPDIPNDGGRFPKK